MKFLTSAFSNPGKFFRGMAILFLVILVNLIITEVVLRNIDATRKWEPVIPLSIKQFDPELGWSFKPNSIATSHRFGYPVTYRINSYGFRGGEFEEGNPKGNYRILLLGASRAFAMGVPEGLHYASLIKGYMQKTEVINASTECYGLDQNLLVFKNIYEQVKPDLVLVHESFMGDRHYNSRNCGKPKPYFTYENDTLVLHKDHIVESTLSYSLLSKLEFLHGLKIFQAASVLAKKIRDRSNGSKPQYDEEADSKVSKESSVAKSNFLRKQIIIEMKKLSDDIGADLAFVTQTKQVENDLNALGIPVLNIRPTLVNPMFSLPDGLGHINISGHGAFTWELYNFLKNNFKEKVIPVESPLPE